MKTFVLNEFYVFVKTAIQKQNWGDRYPLGLNLYMMTYTALDQWRQSMSSESGKIMTVASSFEEVE